MLNALAYHKWVQNGVSLIALLCIALYAYTGVALFLAAPFGVLFLLLIALNWKAAYWVLLFCIPISMHLEFFNGTLSTSVPDEPMMWMFLLLFVVLMAHRPVTMPEWWWRNPLVFIVFAQYLWLIVAVVFSEEHLISIKFLLAKSWFLVSFFALPILVFQKKRDFKIAFFLVLTSMLATMVVIFYRHYTIGFNFRKVEKAINNIYYNHVDYSTVMSMFFPLLLVAFPLLKGKPFYWKLVLAGIALFYLVAIYFTYARAAAVAVVFAVGIGIAIRLRLVNLVMPVFYAAVLSLVLWLGDHNRIIVYRPDFEHTFMHKTFTDHMIATLRGEDMSSMERLYRWVAAVRMSKERPVTGVGPNAFYMYYKPYAISSFRTYVSRNTEHSTTHNYFLYMLVEQGYPAMILYGILIFLIFYQSQKIYYRFKDKDRFYKNVTLGLAMLLAAGFINNFFSELLETHKVGSLFFIGIALLVVLDKKSREAVPE